MDLKQLPLFGFTGKVIRDHSHDGLRSGEGSLVRLKDGALFLMYSEFTGGATDESRAFLATMYSQDEGETWSDPQVFFEPPPDALNAMSASLLRLEDGRIGCVFILKYSIKKMIPFWSVSSDEGVSWSRPYPITEEEGYFAVNNDRLIQLRDGTLIIPYALYQGIGEPHHPNWDPAWNGHCGIFYSRDSGKNWQRSAYSITHTPEIFHEPLFQTPFLLEDPNLKYEFENRLGILQEPGVQELADGSLMLYMRSVYSIYYCFAAGVEQPWENCRPILGFHVCLGPSVIRRIPATHRLFMLYNDRREIPFGTEEFGRRTPVSVAISDDSGVSWKKVGALEGDEREYCYLSLLFHDDAFFTTYYESEVDSSKGPRKLASLKFGRGILKMENK